MELIFLGTAASWPTRDRNLPSVAVRLGSNIILLDCGEGTQRQIQHVNMSFMKIRLILITHFHGDHFLGIPGLLQTMSLNDRKDPLEIVGPVGMEEMGKTLLGLGYFKAGFPIEFLEMKSGDELERDGHTISSIEVDHTIPTLAYSVTECNRPGKFNKTKALKLGVPEGRLFGRLQKGQNVEVGGITVRPEDVMGPARPGRKVVYSGDTAPTDSLIRFAWGADVLIHDSTLAGDMEDKAHRFGHSTSVDAARMAREAGVKTLILFHISSRYSQGDELLDEAREIFPNTHVSRDLWTYPVPFSN